MGNYLKTMLFYDGNLLNRRSAPTKLLKIRPDMSALNIL